LRAKRGNLVAPAAGDVCLLNMNLFKRLSSHRLFWPLTALALLLLFNLFFTKGFFAFDIRQGHLYGYVIDILKWGSVVTAVALGMTLVIATGGIDLSVGSVMAVSGGIAAALVTREEGPVNFGLVVAAALGACTLAGIWNGILVGYAGIQPFVATLILMVAGRGIAQLICGALILTFDGHKSFEALYGAHVLGLPLCILIVLGLFVLTVILTRKTAIGMFIEAVGNNETASRFAGINARMVKVLVYGFSGFCAGVAGLVAASSIRGADSNKAGLMFELYAIFSVVVGGTSLSGGRFTLAGSLVGALLYQTLRTTMYAHGVPSDVTPAYLAVVIVTVCLLQSTEFRRMIRHPLQKIRRGPKREST